MGKASCLEIQVEIKNIKYTTTCDGNITGKMTIEFIPDEQTIQTLSKLYKPQELILMRLSK